MQLDKKSLSNEEFYIYQDNILKDTSRIIGAMLHKKEQVRVLLSFGFVSRLFN